MKRFVTAAGVALALLVAGCTSSGSDSSGDDLLMSTVTSAPSFVTEDAETPESSSEPTSTAVDTSSETSPGEETSAGEETSPGEPTTAGEPTSAGEPTVAGPAGYTPPADAEAVPGDCPYLPLDEVAGDTGQRTGPAAIRAASPFPVCEFIKSGGAYLATVRVLQFATDAEAIAAVDYYLPRETSEPATKPDGWAGGLMVTPNGNAVSPGNPEALSVYGVSKGTTAVIATTNQEQTVYARELVKHAIAHLGL